MDGPRGCHTEGSKSKREKQVSYNKAYIWNLEKWQRWNLSAKQKEIHRCREQMYGPGEYEGGGAGRMNWEI